MEPKDLTPREKEVLIHLTNDLSYKQIAERLGISIHTAKSHINNIYGKTGTHNKVKLYLWFLRNQDKMFGGQLYPKGGAE